MLSGVLIGPSMARAEADVLLAVPLRGGASFIYVLVEHQSSTDKSMPTRMLGYVLRIWEQHQRTHGDDPLPPVFPLVVHHDSGRASAGWAGPTQVLEMLDLEAADEFGSALPQFGFLLDDLVAVSDDELLARGLPEVVLLAFYLLKNASRNRLTITALERVFDVLRAVLVSPQWRDVFLTYIQSAGEAEHTELSKLLARVGRDVEEAFVTTIEKIRIQGLAEGKAEAVLTLLEVRTVAVPASVRKQVVACTDLAQLDTWLRRAAVATTIEELFV